MKLTLCPSSTNKLENITLCDTYDSNTQNGTRLVDLTQRTPDVLAQQPLALSNYEGPIYTSQTAEAGTLPITPATAYMGSDGETISGMSRKPYYRMLQLRNIPVGDRHTATSGYTTTHQ
ncbi:MAG: hypothetical protein U0T80_03865 [Flavobacteriaceae bacterium]